jgi:hypothetical protein
MLKVIIAAILSLHTGLPKSTVKTYASQIYTSSGKYGIDPLLVVAVIYGESRFRRSSCFHGSHGLMQVQLRPRSCSSTRDRALTQGLYDSGVNIKRGVKLLWLWKRWCLRHHTGHHWLLHYNQGFGRCPHRGCSRTERVPVITGKVGGYADRVLSVYRRIKEASVAGRR